jgi:galactose mutarotase-like enzyme
MALKEIEGSLDLTEKKESFALLDAAKREIEFELPDRQKMIRLTYGEEFKYVVLWTEKGQDFVCVEPWMALTNELNRKEQLVMVQPGGNLKTGLKIVVK